MGSMKTHLSSRIFHLLLVSCIILGCSSVRAIELVDAPAPSPSSFPSVQNLQLTGSHPASAPSPSPPSSPSPSPSPAPVLAPDTAPAPSPKAPHRPIRHTKYYRLLQKMAKTKHHGIVSFVMKDTGMLRELQLLEDNFVGTELTFFAPTDDAWDASQSLLMLVGNETGNAILKEILMYHLVMAYLPRGQLRLLSGHKLQSVQGSNLTISVFAKNVVVNNADIVQANVYADGVVAVHSINTVLIPPATLAAYVPTVPTTSGVQALPNIAENATITTKAAFGSRATSAGHLATLFLLATALLLLV